MQWDELIGLALDVSLIVVGAVLAAGLGAPDSAAARMRLRGLGRGLVLLGAGAIIGDVTDLIALPTALSIVISLVGLVVCAAAIWIMVRSFVSSVSDE